MSLKIVINSNNRASCVLTTKVVKNAIVAVPESQVSEYQNYNPDTEILGVPDSACKNPIAKYQWLLQELNHVFFLEDDVTDGVRLYIKKGESSKVESHVATELIHNANDIAEQMGAYLFGFNPHHTLQSYPGHEPFWCSGVTSGFGIRPESKLWFNDNLQLHQHLWISLLNARHHRFAFIDGRFCFKRAPSYKNEPDAKRVDAEFDCLKSYFGKSVFAQKGTIKMKIPF